MANKIVEDIMWRLDRDRQYALFKQIEDLARDAGPKSLNDIWMGKDQGERLAMVLEAIETIVHSIDGSKMRRVKKMP